MYVSMRNTVIYIIHNYFHNVNTKIKNIFLLFFCSFVLLFFRILILRLTKIFFSSVLYKIHSVCNNITVTDNRQL